MPRVRASDIEMLWPVLTVMRDWIKGAAAFDLCRRVSPPRTATNVYTGTTFIRAARRNSRVYVQHTYSNALYWGKEKKRKRTAKRKGKKRCAANKGLAAFICLWSLREELLRLSCRAQITRHGTHRPFVDHRTVNSIGR